MRMWLVLGAFVWNIWLVPPVSAEDQPQTFAFAQVAVPTGGFLLATLLADPVPAVANPCPRFAPGEVIHQPPALFSHEGVLAVRLSYQTRTDLAKRALFCFMTPSGLENPTLHVKPGGPGHHHRDQQYADTSGADAAPSATLRPRQCPDDGVITEHALSWHQYVPYLPCR
jgi:hypothetical protein